MMFLFCSGELIRDPEKRTSAKGTAYAVALLRAGEDLVNLTAFDTTMVERLLGAGEDLVNLTAFDTTMVERLLELRKGDPVSVSGRLAVQAYLGKQGEPKTGLQVTVNEIMTAPARTAKAPPRARRGEDGSPGSGHRAPDFDDPLPPF